MREIRPSGSEGGRREGPVPTSISLRRRRRPAARRVPTRTLRGSGTADQVRVLGPVKLKLPLTGEIWPLLLATVMPPEKRLVQAAAVVPSEPVKMLCHVRDWLQKLSEKFWVP
jgi:hypothetical protein